jgi:transcriptional regulator with XRE-family HTH domain
MKYSKYYNFVGDQFRQHRINNGKSLQDIAERIGVTRMTIANYETARTKIPVDIAKQLCAIYGVDFDEFMKIAHTYL